MDRKQEIVLAAFERIAEQGFEGLRLREVARVVGVDHSTLHHHFPTKEDIVAAVVDYATRQFWQGRAADDSLAAHLAMITEMITARPELFVVLRELDLRAMRDPKIHAIVAEREDGWRRALAGRVRPDLVELVIATVKGVSLRPDLAPEVFARLGEVTR